MSGTRMSGRRLLVALAGVVALAGACSPNGDLTLASSVAKGQDGGPPGYRSPAVGFIFVGPKDDFGYNQAAYQGAMALKRTFPALKILTAENVPETDEAARVLDRMIDKGAKILFATSYGHLDAAMKVALAHPDVVVVQQGNLIKGEIPPNAGTYFGTVFEPVYLAGVVAGRTTKTYKLGFVYAFPITQTIENINAFQLGAQSVNPKVKTLVVSTSSWCDPAKQADAAKSLFDQGVDVITQHQDCTSTITKAAQAAGRYVVGYHADARPIAKQAWVTGSEWAWGDLYRDIVVTARAGTFTGSRYNANFRTGYHDGANPFVQSPYGPVVTEATKQLVEAARARIQAKTGSPFAGPVVAQDGSLLIPAGTVPDYVEIEAKMDTFVQGVVGQIPTG
jgi:basic membrane protein A and related proteins